MGHATLTYIYEENIGSEKGLAVAANLTHAVDGFLVRELVRRCNYDRNKLLEVDSILGHASDRSLVLTKLQPIEQLANDHGFLSLRGVEFITINNVLDYSLEYRNQLAELINELLNQHSFTVITIHDEFKCHPRYMNDLRETYMSILAELADSNVGQQILRDVRNDDTYILQKLSTDLGDQIMKSEYFLS